MLTAVLSNPLFTLFRICVCVCVCVFVCDLMYVCDLFVCVFVLFWAPPEPQNMMTMPDFMESDSDALSQILRSVAPPGGGGGGGAPPLVRVVRGTGPVEGRWTEVTEVYLLLLIVVVMMLLLC